MGIEAVVENPPVVAAVRKTPPITAVADHIN